MSLITFLRPVDQMIEAGAKGLPQTQFGPLNELYVLVKSESNIVKRFNDWWDIKSQKVKRFQEYLYENYDIERIEYEIKKQIEIKNIRLLE